MRKKTTSWTAVSFLLIASCAPIQRDLNDNIDPTLRLSRNDYKNATNLETLLKTDDGVQVLPPGAEPPIPELDAKPQVSFKPTSVVEPKIPDLAEIIAAPRPPKLGQSKLVSVAVTDDVPLKDVLIELARLADVDIEVDSGIAGGISFRAKDRPFNEVIERISSLAGLRYSMRNNVLRVERDLPYIQTYMLDMLNIDRSSSGSFDITSAGAGAGTGTGGSVGGSSSKISADSKGDFWEKFKETLDKIIGYQQASFVSDATVQPQPAAPQPQQSVPPQGGDQSMMPPGGPENSVPVMAPPVPPQVRTATSGPGNSSSAGSFYSLNRQSGTLTVSGTEHQHEIIRRFLHAIESNISAQVLIEAKIVEVTLNDRYQTGINWGKFGGTSLNFTGNFLPAINSANAGIITFNKSDIFKSGIDLNGVVRLLDEFGTTRALSSPRLNATNNQQAVLSFAENIVYFNVILSTTDAVAGTGGSAGTPAKVTVTSTMQKAPVGITLALQPSINMENNEITLSVRPTLTRVTKFVDDPSFEINKAIAAAQITDTNLLASLAAVKSPIPQLEVRELDSMLKVASGQVMVIGGLLEDRVTNNDAGVPAISEVPVFGNLFKAVDKLNSKKELIILLRATIVSPRGSADAADKAIYEKFTDDPRPLNF